MSGIFLNSGLLWLGALVGVPILIYLINRQRFRRRKWAAMVFLLKALKKSRRRLQIQNLLLLLIRCLILLLLVLAVSRPVLHSNSQAFSSEGNKNWIFAIDTSYSMEYVDGASSLLDRAKQTILDVVTSYAKEDDYVAVMTLDYQPNVIFERSQMSAPRKALLESELDRLASSNRGVRLVTSLRSIADLADQFVTAGGTPEPCRIVFLSDLQRKDWLGKEGPRSPEIKQLFDEFNSEGHELVFSQLAAAESNRSNVAITDLTVKPDLFAKGVAVEIQVTLRNYGSREVDGLDFTVRVDPPVTGDPGEAQAGEILRIPAGGVVTRSLPYRFDSPGYHSVVAEVRSDGLVVDNKRFFTVDVRDQIEILLVDGDPAVDPLERETFYLQTALQPRDDAMTTLGGRITPFQPVNLTADLLRDVEWKRFSLVVLANVADIPVKELETLRRYVAEGGFLVVFMGANVDPQTYNRIFHAPGPERLLPFEVVEERGDSLSPVYLQFSDKSHPVVDYFAQHKERTELHRALVPFYRFMKMGAEPGGGKESTARVFCRYNDLDRSPAVFDNSYGRGRVLWFTSSADDDWNEFPAWQDYVVFLYESIAYLVGFRRLNDNLGVGEEFQRFYDSSRFAYEVKLHAPPLPGRGLTGSRTVPMAMRELDDSGRFSLAYGQTDVPGLYRLELRQGQAGAGEEGEASAAKKTIEYFSVNVSTDESDLRGIEASEMESHFGVEASQLLNYSEEVETRQQQKALRRDRELWKYFLVAAIALLFLETALAQFVGRRAG
ncbi:MAG: BatA domain-containing protein [Planctomycetota bacterium]|nr:BatA domain-containing protein [Planctomycetota bacterium]